MNKKDDVCNGNFEKNKYAAAKKGICINKLNELLNAITG